MNMQRIVDVLGLMGKKNIVTMLIVVLAVNLCFAGISTAQSSDSPLILTPKPLEAGNLRIAYHAHTGKVIFLGAEAGHSIRQPRTLMEVASPEEAARSFLSFHGALFGLKNQAEELQVMKVGSANRGRTFVRFQQTYKGIPVFGGELFVEMEAAKNITSINGEILPDLDLITTPTITAEMARQTTLIITAKEYELTADTLTASDPSLWIYSPLLLDRPALKGSLLVWQTEATSQEQALINELVLVDAQSGEVVLHFNQIRSMRK